MSALWVHNSEKLVGTELRRVAYQSSRVEFAPGVTRLDGNTIPTDIKIARYKIVAYDESNQTAEVGFGFLGLIPIPTAKVRLVSGDTDVRFGVTTLPTPPPGGLETNL